MPFRAKGFRSPQVRVRSTHHTRQRCCEGCWEQTWVTMLCWSSKGRKRSYCWVLPSKQPLLFATAFLPHFNHIVLLEPSIIPCLPWPQVWDNMIQDKPLKFLPQRLLIWSRRRAFVFGPQTLERHENKLLVPSYLTWKRPICIRREQNYHTNINQFKKEGEEEKRRERGWSKGGEKTETVIIPLGPLTPQECLDFSVM